jgi:hypothetical protein
MERGEQSDPSLTLWALIPSLALRDLTQHHSPIQPALRRKFSRAPQVSAMAMRVLTGCAG